MIELQDNRNKLVAATAVVGILAAGTFTAGFTMMYLDYINYSDFFSGVGLGLSIAAMPISVIGCVAKYGLFNKPSDDLESPKLSEDDYLINRF